MSAWGCANYTHSPWKWPCDHCILFRSVWTAVTTSSSSMQMPLREENCDHDGSWGWGSRRSWEGQRARKACPGSPQWLSSHRKAIFELSACLVWQADPHSTASFPNPRVDALYLQKVCPHQVDRNRISFLAWGLLKVILSPCFLFCPAAVLSLHRVMLTELSTLRTDQVASSRGPWAYWIKGKPSAWSTSPTVSWCLPSALAADPTTYLQLNSLLCMCFLFHFIFY